MKGKHDNVLHCTHNIEFKQPYYGRLGINLNIREREKEKTEAHGERDFV